MSELATRIYRAIEDLQSIKAELEQAADPKAPSRDQERVIQDAKAMLRLRELKSLVDHMRHLLWAYLDSGATPNPRDVSTRLQGVRRQRVTEMLKGLEPDVLQPTTTALPESETFFELINHIAHKTVDRHQRPL